MGALTENRFYDIRDFLKSPPLAFVLLFLGLAAYTIYGAIWRLYLSPVAHIPGPWFAKLTFWNEFYYDVILGGQYTWKLPEYHAKYGPVIRINPYEVHVLDQDFHHEVYVGYGKRRTEKWWWAWRMGGRPNTTILDTFDHAHHRARREPWNPYFSKSSVARALPHMQVIVDKFCDRIAQERDAKRPVTMTPAYACMTIDIISQYTFPWGYNFLDQEGFNPQVYDAFMYLSRLTVLFKQFGWLAPLLLNAVPVALTKYLSPGMYSLLSNETSLQRQVQEVITRRKNGTSSQGEMTGRTSLIEALLDSNLPASEKTVKPLAGTAMVSIGAGTLTTAHTLKHATYHILANPHIQKRLMDELEEAMPDPMQSLTLHELESCEYLVVIMYESLRNIKMPSHRLQRIFPDTDLYYPGSTGGGQKLPAGTPISMTGALLSDNPTIFPDPYSFQPERWLPLSTNGARLWKHMMPFGQGSRSCVGMELGKAEVLLTLATLFRRFGRNMRLAGGTERKRDVDIVADYFISMSSLESNGVVVMF